MGFVSGNLGTGFGNGKNARLRRHGFSAQLILRSVHVSGAFGVGGFSGHIWKHDWDISAGASI